ncbi:MAG: nucleotidyltransferase family protein [Actinomycetota bacterium]|nr:nucleotidyltransferase family protein [Actinomycetota bacterium]
MKAFLLAAGLGTRLRPITDTLPKCMVPVAGRPLLDIWLDNMARAGIDEVLVNLHHLPHMVAAHLDGRRGPPGTRTAFEPTLLGSAGTLVANRGWTEDQEVVLAFNADNLTDFDLRLLIDAHLATTPVATLAVIHTEHPRQCGILEVDDGGVMTAFTEKPAEPKGDLANAGMYAFDPAILDEIGAPPKDIGFDVLPSLVGRARTLTVSGYFRDIGSPHALQQAELEWPEVART